MAAFVQDPCQNCGAPIPRPSGSACHADPCPSCRFPRPLGDCSDLTVGPPAGASLDGQGADLGGQAGLGQDGLEQHGQPLRG